MGYSGGGGGGGGGGGSGGSGGSGGGYGGAGGGTGYGGSDEFELPSYNQAPPGSIRFNTDSKKLEVYILGSVGVGTLPNGIWMEVDSWSPDLLTGGTRMLVFGGYNTTKVNEQIDILNISTTGDATDFGNLNSDGHGYGMRGGASRTRAVMVGGRDDPSPAASFNIIQYVEIAQQGDSIDFGDLTGRTTYHPLTGGNSTRLLIAGGNTSPGNVFTNDIQYITIASLGNSVEFGDLTGNRAANPGCASPTRTVFIGGRTAPGAPNTTNAIEYVTTATLGNAADFGDTTQAGVNGAAGSNSVRGVYGSYAVNPDHAAGLNVVEYLTMATLGDTKDFGDATDTICLRAGGASPTRVVFAGGERSPANVTTADYGQIMSTGNFVDFGDLQEAKQSAGGATNGHGGL